MNDKPFELRSYSKAELAMMYNPDTCITVALQTLGRWIRTNPSLMEELTRLNYNKYRRVFTPKEVERIVFYIGEP